MSEELVVGTTSRAFIAAAFDVLKEEHVIPTPVFRFVAVGRDYSGPRIMALPEYQALEALLNDAYPERFAKPITSEHAEFASTYMFSLLEACVARCALNCRSDSSAVDQSIEELLAVLGTPAYEVVCCRHVSHLTTTSGDDAEIGHVTVVPESGQRGRLVERIQHEIPSAPRAWSREEPRPYDLPHSLLITRTVTDDPDAYEVGNRLSRRLERFLLLARLITAGTVQSAYEVSGTTTMVARIEPLMRTFRKGFRDALVRRTVRLTGDEGPAFLALNELIDGAAIKREGMSATSFDVAISKYNGSHVSDSPYEHLVDLATALEAALIGGEQTEEVTLRLRSRVAALLATRDDPAMELFDDVGHLYSLRSTLVHGGQIKQKDLAKRIAKISTVPVSAVEHRFGVALGHAVDRMRDLVRRAILARLCLAAEPNPSWPFYGTTPVDATLSDDAQRSAWRASWHKRLAIHGLEHATGRPRAAVDFLSQDDRSALE